MVDDLIIRVLKGEASPFEVERLRRWRNESSENDSYCEEISLVWELTAPEPQASASSPPGVEAILQAAASRGLNGAAGEKTFQGDSLQTEQESPQGPGREGLGKRSRRPPRRFWGLMAASIATVGLGIRLVGPGGPEPLAEYTAPPGETRTVTLDDGSFVRLASGSRLQVWRIGDTREVSLDGRAFFAVTRDESRPFVVRAGAGEVRVLGTRFEVAEEEAGVRTIVVEGLVAVSNEAGSVEVPAGGLARMARGEVPALEAAEDVWGLLEWPDGVLIFQSTPLSQVAAEVSQHFGRPLVVADTSLQNRRITAWFQWEPFEEVAEAICMVLDASCSEGGAGVTVRPRNGVGEVR
jgi:transmembrane sensor